MARSDHRWVVRLLPREGSFLSDRSGVTLLELAIASGILAVTLVLLISGIVSVSEAHSITADRTAASLAFEETIEQIHSLTYDELLVYQPPAPRALGSSATLTISCLDATGTALNTPINPSSLTQPLPNPIEVRIVAQWSDDRGRPMRAQTTCLFKR